MKNKNRTNSDWVFSKSFACIIALFLLFSPASNADAGTPEAIAIIMHAARNGPNTFEAAGAINDSGSVTLDSVRATALPSPVVGTGHYIRTYNGVNGTLTIKLETLLTATDVPWLWNETGHWVIIGATGAYAGLRGEGDESGVRDFSANTLDAVFNGKVH